jgi:subtilisin family serine protease
MSITLHAAIGVDAVGLAGSAAARLRRLSGFAALATLAAATMYGPVLAQPQGRSGPAPVTKEDSRFAIRGQYIVVFQEQTARARISDAQRRVSALGAKILHIYVAPNPGFSVRLPSEPDRAKAALELLRALPDVAFIEADQLMQYDTIQPPTPPGAPGAGLDRIDRRLLGVLPAPPLNGTYTYSETGTGVHAYVIDSGVRITHNEFGGRATDSFTVAGADFSDCINHGTHVAGIVGGTTFGIAKAVAIHNVRVGTAGTCAPTTANVRAGVQWVTANRTLPAVANISIRGPVSLPLNADVAALVAASVTVAVAAGNDTGDNACNWSPASEPSAITVGNTDPTNDTRATSSNIGPCLDLFAPGENILSASRTSDSATVTLSGTSMASPHVAGVAARYLQTHAAATPAAVWTAIHNANNVATTAGWGGVGSLGAGSPNELLHYGSLADGFTDGDPHIRTTDGVQYDFQSAGEFTLLRDGNGLEIQTRQRPVSTQPPIANPHTGLAACVSLNEAVAARVAGRRVTYQPGEGRMVLRVDGAATPVTAQGLALGQGARVAATGAGDGIAIDFPDGTHLTATSHFWGAPHNRWYLNVSVFQTPASEGVMGDIAAGSWLPALPNGASLGPKPAAATQRFVDLYETFEDAWRVSDATSLFDYGSGESAATFAVEDWPPQNGSCVVPELPLAEPMPRAAALRICRGVRNRSRQANCVFDVAITGHAGFAKAYLLSQRIEAGATRTALNVDGDRLGDGRLAKLVATVSRRATGGKGAPVGSVRFSIDGEASGKPVKLDERGWAAMAATRLAPGKHRVEARFEPMAGGTYLPSVAESYIIVGEDKAESDQRVERR